MTTINDLQKSFDDVINLISPGVNVNLNRNTNDAVFAIYIYGLILRAIEQVAVPDSLELRSINSGNLFSFVSNFIVRGAPGYIYSINEDYGYAIFNLSGEWYEVHFGVRYYGTSKVLHEYDISILKEQEANRCRQTRTSPRHPRAVFECKFYSNNLGIELGREFVGLVSDFPGIPIRRLVTNSGSESIEKFLKPNTRPKFNGYILPNSQFEQRFIHAVADDIMTKLN